MFRIFKLASLIILNCLFVLLAQAQTTIPAYYHQDKKLNDSLKSIIKQVGLDSTYDAGEDGTEQISLAVIDLTGSKPVFGGVNADNFIYPASVYKMYVARKF